MIDFSLSNKLSDDIVISNDLICLLQQVDLLFNTDINDVLGDINFGSNYDKYLYTLGMSNEALQEKILSDIKKLELFGYTPAVNVSIVEGTQRDIAFIDITFTGDYDDYNKTYVIK
jgi:hypothetical protein